MHIEILCQVKSIKFIVIQNLTHSSVQNGATKKNNFEMVIRNFRTEMLI